MAWRELLLATIGEQLDLGHSDEVCGLTITTRQYDNLVQIWNSNANEAAVGSAHLLEKINELMPGVHLKSFCYKGSTFPTPR